MITDTDRDAVTSCDGRTGVECTGSGASALGELVQPVDGLGGDREHRDRLPLGAAGAPVGEDLCGHVEVGAVVEPAVSFIHGEDFGIAGAQTHAGGPFPWLVEAVDAVQLDDPFVRRQVREHAAAAHPVELVRVADENYPPAVGVRQACECGEFRSGEHACFVDDDRRAEPQAEAEVGARSSCACS